MGNRDKKTLEKTLCFAAAVPAQGTQVVTDNNSFGFLMTQLAMLVNSESQQEHFN